MTISELYSKFGKLCGFNSMKSKVLITAKRTKEEIAKEITDKNDFIKYKHGKFINTYDLSINFADIHYELMEIKYNKILEDLVKEYEKDLINQLCINSPFIKEILTKKIIFQEREDCGIIWHSKIVDDRLRRVIQGELNKLTDELNSTPNKP